MIPGIVPVRMSSKRQLGDRSTRRNGTWRKVCFGCSLLLFTNKCIYIYTQETCTTFMYIYKYIEIL